ncbi:MAG: Rrf2 family transcriptional regulator [Gorillibacterium sp.]|nr:Rrf2 family transcriptional regulator [Gorillibacterium sp.]
MAQLKRFGFGLQALIALASQPDQWSSAEIAEHIHCEPTALRKILSQLAEAGLVEVKQGRTGGYRLGKRPEEMTLSEVYRAVHDEDPQWDRMLETTGAGLFGSKVRDSFYKIMNDINSQVDGVLSTYTIADLVE